MKTFMLLSLAFLGALAASGSMAALTELELVEHGLADANFNGRLEAQISEAEGQLQAAGHWDNPEITYSRESLDLREGSSDESSFWLTQRIHLSGVKGLEKVAASHVLNAARANVEIARRDWVRRLRERFYQALAASKKSTAIAGQQRRLQSIVAIVEQRAHQGDASQFDALRIKKALVLINSAKAGVDTDAIAAQKRLFDPIDLPIEPLSGMLLPPAVSFTALGVDEHPQLQSLLAMQQHYETQSEVANRGHWPALTVAVGRKELDEPSFSADGNTVSLGIEIPLFDRGQGHDKAAKSRATQLQYDISLLRRELETQFETSQKMYQANQQTAEQLKILIQSPLSQLAQASYQAGEFSVMELLDAYQSDLESTLRFIDISLAARLAYIQLQHLGGE